jgi:hypothetical protein
MLAPPARAGSPGIVCGVPGYPLTAFEILQTS